MRQTSNWVHYVLNIDFTIPKEQNHYTQFKLDIFKTFIDGEYHYKYHVTIIYRTSSMAIRHILSPIVLPLERLTNIYNNLYDALINNSSNSASGQSTQEN